MEDTATVTPGPDTSQAPAMMLSGGMQGPPPQVDTTTQPNVTQGPADGQPAMMLSGGGMQGPPPQVDTTPQPNVTQAGSGAAADPEMIAAAHHHGRIGAAIDAVSKALGGSRAMHIVEMPDGSYVAREMDTTPGERWSRIAKAALSGAAAGFANGQGPGGGARAAAAGVQSGLALPQAEQDKTMQKAGDLELQREKQIQFNKNMALLDLQTTKLNLENMNAPIEFSAKMQAYADTQRKEIAAAHGTLVATYHSMKDLNDHLQSNQELADKMVGTGGVLRQVPIYTNGKQTGADIYGIPADYLNLYNDKRVEIPVEALSPDNTKIVSSTHVIEPGTQLNSSIEAAKKKQELDNQTAHTNLAKIQAEKETADAAMLKAQTDDSESASRIAKNFAEASKARGDADNPDLKLTSEVDSQGRPLVIDKKGNLSVAKVPEGMTPIKATDMATFRKTYQAPAVKAEQAYNMLKQIDANVQAGIVNPIEQRTAVRMAMQEAAGMAPGTGVGGRGGQSSKDFEGALKARGLADDKINLIEKMLNGAQITKTQSRDILASYNLLRRAQWRTAGEMGAVSGMKPDDVIPATVLGRDKIMGELYAQPGTGNASQAARQPGAEQTGQTQPGQTQPKQQEPPAPQGATMEYRDKQGNLQGWAVNGKFVGR